MFNIGVAASVLGLIFIAELPDKTAIASLVLGSKYPARWVFSGVAAAFTLHIIIAVAAGSLLTLLPGRPLEAIVGALFLIGAFLLWFHGAEEEEEVEEQVSKQPSTASFSKVAGTSFGIIFIAEWGDLTQILCANLAAKFHSPLSVGVGATLGLWAVGLLAILGGRNLLRVLPLVLIVRIAATVMFGLAAYSIYRAIRG